MTYSKWDPSANVYHYYQTAEPDNKKKKTSMKNTKLGVAADNAGHDLPSDAKFVGFGTQARGLLVKVHDTSNSLLDKLIGLLK